MSFFLTEPYAETSKSISTLIATLGEILGGSTLFNTHRGYLPTKTTGGEQRVATEYLGSRTPSLQRTFLHSNTNGYLTLLTQ